MGLNVRNIMENITKITTFNHIGIFTPLYDENFTIVASITNIDVRIKPKTSAFFLDKFKVVKLVIFSFILRNGRYERNILYNKN